MTVFDMDTCRDCNRPLGDTEVRAVIRLGNIAAVHDACEQRYQEIQRMVAAACSHEFPVAAGERIEVGELVAMNPDGTVKPWKR